MSSFSEASTASDSYSSRLIHRVFVHRVLFIASYSSCLVHRVLFIASCSSCLVHQVLLITSCSLRLVHRVLFIQNPWVLTATRRADPDSPIPSFTAVPQITNRVLYEAMPQESEHNMGDFEISLNTFPIPQTNVGRLQIPTIATELAIIAQQYAEDFLS